MPYSIDMQWMGEAMPTLAQLPQAELWKGKPGHTKLEIMRHDFPLMFDAANAAATWPEGVTEVKHELTAWDGAKIAVYQFSPPAAAAGAASGPGPAALHFHSGGLVSCSVANTQKYVALLAKESGIPLFSVEYRLAPEHPGVAIIKDAYSALQWLHAHAAELNVDPARVAAVGESAGGTISAGLCLYARDQGFKPLPKKQVLTYPSVDHRTPFCDPEMRPFVGWAPEDALEAWTHVLGGRDPNGDVDDVEGLQYISPARAKSLEGMPDTYLEVTSLDILAPEGVDFAMRLRKEAKVQVELHVWPGLAHGYDLIDATPTIAQVTRARKVAALKSV